MILAGEAPGLCSPEGEGSSPIVSPYTGQGCGQGLPTFPRGEIKVFPDKSAVKQPRRKKQQLGEG